MTFKLMNKSVASRESDNARAVSVEEIKTQQIEMQTQAQERASLYAHDIEIGKGASQWVTNSILGKGSIVYPFFLIKSVNSLILDS